MTSSNPPTSPSDIEKRITDQLFLLHPRHKTEPDGKCPAFKAAEANLYALITDIAEAALPKQAYLNQKEQLPDYIPDGRFDAYTLGTKVGKNTAIDDTRARLTKLTKRGKA